MAPLRRPLTQDERQFLLEYIWILENDPVWDPWVSELARQNRIDINRAFKIVYRYAER